MNKSVIILGSGPGWKECPYDKEVWSVAKLLMLEDKEKPIRRVDRLYSLDDIDHLLSIQRGMFTKEAFVKAINDRAVPYISSLKCEAIPLSQEFDLKRALTGFKVGYFTNTICYMIADALLEGYNEIHLWGISQSGAHEYVAERKGVEFWLGMALGQGVEIVFNTPTGLIRNDSGYPYGYVKTFDQLKAEGKI